MFLSTRTSGTYRAVEIILGIVALIIGGLALAFPIATVVSIVFFFGIALLAIGILRLATGASADWLPGASRKTNVVIGILAIIFGLIIMFAPFFSAEIIIIMIGFALVIYGVGRMVVGGAAHISGGMRALLIIFGLIVAVFGLIVIFFPVVGAYTYAFFVSLAFIIIGIDALASGISGTPLT
jgi:uncharacterized membrane protein HdeD (DUF308 family)